MKVSRHKIGPHLFPQRPCVTRLTSHDTTPDFLEKKENLIDIIRIQIWIYESKGIIPGKGSRFRRKGTMRGVRDDTMRACRTMGFGPAEV